MNIDVNEVVEAIKLQKEYIKEHQGSLGAFGALLIIVALILTIISLVNVKFYFVALGFYGIGLLACFLAGKDRQKMSARFEAEYPTEAGILKQIEPLKLALKD